MIPCNGKVKMQRKTINFSILYRLRCCFIVSSPLWMYLMCEYKIKPDHISSVRSKEREQEDDLTYHGSNDKAFGIHHQEDADA